jgi:hypothetical protein
MESRFRAANERIARQATELDYDGWVPFVCECADERCFQLIRVPLADYQEIVATPGRFLLFPGHRQPSGDVHQEQARGADEKT